MQERSKTARSTQTAGASSASVDALATRALSLVAQRNSKSASQLDLALAETLHEAAAEVGSNPVPDVVDAMLQAGVPAETIAVTYIPHVACSLGDEWCENTLSFARVTIGTARLQSALRSLGKEWWAKDRDDNGYNSSGVIIIVAKDAYHTLGAAVLCGQMRKLGLSVRLAMGASKPEIQAIFRSTEFDAALISASGTEPLDSLREYVETIRQSASVCPPIVIGGSVLDREVDVTAATGADFATKDPFEALEHCGLINPVQMKIAQTKRGT